MPRRKKSEIEKFKDVAAIPAAESPHDRVEHPHIDELTILMRALSFMRNAHPDTTRENTAEFIEAMRVQFSFPLAAGGLSGPKPEPRRDVVEALRLINAEYVARSAFGAEGTVFDPNRKK